MQLSIETNQLLGFNVKSLKRWFTHKNDFPLLHCSPALQYEYAINFFLAAVHTWVQLFTRVLRVASPAGVGVPTMAVIDVLTKK